MRVIYPLGRESDVDLGKPVTLALYLLEARDLRITTPLVGRQYPLNCRVSEKPNPSESRNAVGNNGDCCDFDRKNGRPHTAMAKYLEFSHKFLATLNCSVALAVRQTVCSSNLRVLQRIM